MVDLARQIAAEKENVERALAAIATFLHNIYNGMENILKQILKAKGTEIPKSETWHMDLLDLSAIERH